MYFPPKIYFTRAQLWKLHRQFFHPSAQKLFNLLRRTRPEEATPETLNTLRNLSKRCDPCQRIQNAPTRFRVSFGAETVRFNERILLDVMYIDGKPVLHIVDEGTHFSAAQFLPDVSTKTIWKAILQCWATIYTGLLNRMLVDQGSAFGPLFINIGVVSNVGVDRTGIEAYSSLGLGERYHQPLRQTDRKIMVEHPSSDPALALALSVKAMNDTLSPEGLVTFALVFGEFARIFTKSETPNERSVLVSRSKVAKTARNEMGKRMAEVRVRRALKNSTPSASSRVYSPGDEVLVCRERVVDNGIGEWIGPFTVLAADETQKIVFVQDVRIGAARPFNIAQVKHYNTPETLANSFFAALEKGLSWYSSANADAEDIYLTEVLNRDDPRGHSKQMEEAKREEIKNLLDRGTFKIILTEDVPQDGNVLPGRFVLAIKSTDDGKTKYKARYVIGGHWDRLKHMMAHTTSTLQPQSIRLLLALAAIHGFDIWTSDVRQAYLQSTEPLTRNIFIKRPVPEFELDPSQCLKLLKPLYGLCESGDMWHATLDNHHIQDLGMMPLRSDPALYLLVTNGLLKGISGGYVDDLIRTGDSSFKQLCSKTKRKFDMAEDQGLPCTFTGFSISRTVDNTIVQQQHEYLRRLEELPPDASFPHFRSMRMKLAWLSNTRPDCLFEISQLAQVTEEKYSTERSVVIRRINRATRYAVQNRISLKVPSLNKDTLRVIGFSDSSFANNADLSSQLGHICLLGDHTGALVPINFKSCKSRRVLRSSMVGEVIAFRDLFDVATTLASELEFIFSRKVPVQIFTDSISFFDVISKGSRRSDA